jgi:hypothetical protein
VAGDEYERAIARFAGAIGEAFEPDKPVLVLCFERPEQKDAYFGGHMPLPGVYWASWGRRDIVICKQEALDMMRDPAELFRVLLAYYFFDARNGFIAPAWLLSCLGSLVGSSDPDADLRAAHRHLRVCRWSDEEQRLGPWALPQREHLHATLHRHEWTNAEVLAKHSSQTTSLAAYLAGDAAGGRRESFAQLLRGLKRRDRPEEAFRRHFGHGCEEIVRQWRAWVAEQDCEGHDAPPPRHMQHLLERLLPLVRDPQAPLEQRLRAIRNMRSGGYLLGADALIEALSENDHSLRAHAVWALESISGRSFGDDVDRWRQWWDDLPSASRAADAKTAEAPVPVEAASPQNDAEPIVAELVEPGETEANKTSARPFQSGAPSSAARGEPVPPRSLRAIWMLLIVSGVVAIIWSMGAVFAFAFYVPILGCAGVGVGVYALTKGVGRDVKRLASAAWLTLLCFPQCNIISFALGLTVVILLRRPDVRLYVVR